MKEEFSSRIEQAKDIITKLTKDKSNIQHGLSKQQSWLSQFREYENVSEISRILIVSLVERINVSENSEIEVVFRYKDQFADIMEFLREQPKLAEGKKIIPIPRLEVV